MAQSDDYNNSPSPQAAGKRRSKRPAKARLMATETALRILNEPVMVKEGGKVRELKTLDAALYSLFAKAAKGDFRAQKELILLGERVGVRWRPTSSIEIKFFDLDEYGRPFEVDMGLSPKPPSKPKGGQNRVPGSLLREQRLMGGALERDDEGIGHAHPMTTSTRINASGSVGEVGYKRPPKAGQIKPGEVRNPYGRAGKHKRTRRTVNDLIEGFLLEECTIITGDLHSSMTRYEAIFRMLLNSSLKGNSAANRFLVEKALELHFIEARPHHLRIHIHFVEAVRGKFKVYPPPPEAV